MSTLHTFKHTRRYDLTRVQKFIDYGNNVAL